MTNNRFPITPNLWFDRQAEEAANYYVSVFPNSRVVRITRAAGVGVEITGLTEGTVMTVEFEIEGQRFIAINGGPEFRLNPSISFLVACRTKNEVDALWQKLCEPGKALMDPGAYPFSERYGWAQDRYGCSWQLMLMRDQEIKQKITPTLMFTDRQCGKAEAAVNFYTRIFANSTVDHFVRYDQGEEPDKAGTIRHAAFVLDGQALAAMDSARVHQFTFNEAISLMVECQTQPEIDHYWEKLIASGGQESFCGWLKDQFGVSWQIAPAVLAEMLRGCPLPTCWRMGAVSSHFSFGSRPEKGGT